VLFECDCVCYVLNAVCRHASESESTDRPLPYEVSGHTILKKTVLTQSPSVNSNGSMAGDGESTPPVNKHASFRDEVVVIEFDKKCKVQETAATHVVQLHDALIDDYDSHAACQRFEYFAMKETIAAMTRGSLSSDDTDDGDGETTPSFTTGDADSELVDSVSVASGDQ